MRTGIGQVDRSIRDCRVLLISGSENSGKTCLAASMGVLEARPLVYITGYILKSDVDFIKSQACDSPVEVVSAPLGEELVHIALSALTVSGSIVVVDDAYHVVPMAEARALAGDRTPGAQARLLCFLLEQAWDLTEQFGSNLVLVTEDRAFEKYGFFGDSLLEMCDGALMLRRTSGTREDGTIETRVETHDGSVGVIRVNHERGYSLEESILDTLVEHEYFVKKGAVFYETSSGVFFRRESLLDHIAANADTFRSVLESFLAETVEEGDDDKQG